jgi:aminoglycoside phosphotransferase (APT) family kinase protein
LEASQINYKQSSKSLMTIGAKVGAGRTATIFRYGANQVIKLFRANFSIQAITEEFEIGRSLNKTGLSVPSTHDLLTIDGRSGISLDYFEGHSMLQNLASKPWMVLSYAKRMAQLHYEIHQAKNIKSKYLRPLKDSLAEKISRVALLSEEEKTMILAHLSNLQDGSALCHGDFHPDNIIMSKTKMVTVDWITASIGNPIADVARTWLLLTMGTLPEDRSHFEIFLATHLRDLFCRIYMREYIRLSDLSLTEFDKWKLPVAAARLLENVSAQENQNLLTFIRLRLKPVRISRIVA